MLDDDRIKAFSNIVFEAGISAPVRTLVAATLMQPAASSRRLRSASAALSRKRKRPEPSPCFRPFAVRW
jgi:hypothetical protein